MPAKPASASRWCCCLRPARRQPQSARREVIAAAPLTLATRSAATGIYRELAASWPDVYQRELEQSLQIAAWLENGEDLSDASSREPKK